VINHAPHEKRKEEKIAGQARNDGKVVPNDEEQVPNEAIGGEFHYNDGNVGVQNFEPLQTFILL
jgi:hypothetical protein